MSETASSADRRQRVLVVEDEHQICELLADILQAEGFDPLCAQRDKAAFRALHADPGFACMIVDVNLREGTTGYDVARFARRLAPALPVIFVSGQTSDASFAANSVPGSLFLPKPFSPDELMQRLRKLIGDNDDA
jgi:DNA-binding response OmpR family regulator